MEFRTPYERVPSLGETFDGKLGKSRTQQNFKKECDINNIMAGYERTGLMSHVARFQGQYGDVTGAVDYHSAQNAVIQETEMFMTLPAAVRSKFANDPGAFLQFVEDPANEAEMRELGLLPPAKPNAGEPAPAAEGNTTTTSSAEGDSAGTSSTPASNS